MELINLVETAWEGMDMIHMERDNEQVAGSGDRGFPVVTNTSR